MVVNVLQLLNKFNLFVRTKSMQRGFSDWNQAGVFIELSRLNSVKKSERYLLEVFKLKYPRRITCSRLER